MKWPGGCALGHRYLRAAPDVRRSRTLEHTDLRELLPSCRRPRQLVLYKGGQVAGGHPPLYEGSYGFPSARPPSCWPGEGGDHDTYSAILFSDDHERLLADLRVPFERAVGEPASVALCCRIHDTHRGLKSYWPDRQCEHRVHALGNSARRSFNSQTNPAVKLPRQQALESPLVYILAVTEKLHVAQVTIPGRQLASRGTDFRVGQLQRGQRLRARHVGRLVVTATLVNVAHTLLFRARGCRGASP